MGGRRFCNLLVNNSVSNLGPNSTNIICFSYINRIPRSWGYSPMTEGCDLVTKTSGVGRRWTNVWETEISAAEFKILCPIY